MKRSASVVAIGTTALLALATATAMPAEAGTPKWLRVGTPSKTTAYNGGKASVAPKAKATGNRVISSLRIAAYRGKKRVGSGKTVKLKPGKYTTVTSGTYRPFVVIAVNRTRRVLHQGDLKPATCRVSSAQPDGFGGTTSTATCRNGYYPRQPQTDMQFRSYQVGDTYSETFFFDDEYVTQTYKAKVRSYGKTAKFSSAKRKLTVTKGGFRKQFRGRNSVDTGNFKVPKKSWRISYSFSCSDYSNMIIWLRKSNGELVDLVANEIGTSSRGSVRENGSGKYYLEVESDSGCSWTITVR